MTRGYVENVWTERMSTAQEPNNARREDANEEIIKLINLTEEIRKLSRSIDLTGMLCAVKELNVKLGNCHTKIEKFEAFVQFCQQIE